MPVGGHSRSAVAEGGAPGDQLLCGSNHKCIELLNRTAFINNPLWAFHHTHNLFHFLVHNAALFHDLGGNSRLDPIAFGHPDASSAMADVSPITLQPLLLRSGLILPAASEGQGSSSSFTADLTCFRRSVIGTAAICPTHGCENFLSEEGTAAIAKTFRTRHRVRYVADTQQAPRVLLVIQREGDSRSIVNIDQVIDVLNAFSGFSVVPINLENADLAEQVRLFSNASFVIAAHGNALGNMLWMPPGSVMMELFGDGFFTDFFSFFGGARQMTWRQVRCKSDKLRSRIDSVLVEHVLGSLASTPKLAWMVSHDLKDRLLGIQAKVDAQNYIINPNIVRSKKSFGSINFSLRQSINATCVFESPKLDAGDTDVKHRHIFIPPAQFLEEFLAAVQAWQSAWL
jgi:hypothetical protein